jgi:hypothetical protein
LANEKRKAGKKRDKNRQRNNITHKRKLGKQQKQIMPTFERVEEQYGLMYRL